MEQLTNRGIIKELMERHGFNFSRSLGQNFIINPSVCPRISQLGGATPERGVLEIGAGIGVLTAELARRAKKVVCVEIDSRLLGILDETLAEFNNVKIINNDILKVNLPELLEREFAGLEVVVCANLPYYITSPIIMSLLEQRLPIESITVMVQREAAQRICAPPGTRECGAISAAVAYYCKPQILFTVSRGSFMPSPDVDSCVIRLDIHKQPPITVQSEQLLTEVVRGAFGQRRKTILNTLSSALGLGKPQLRELLEQSNVDPGLRAEALTLADFGAIANAVYRLRQENIN